MTQEEWKILRNCVTVMLQHLFLARHADQPDFARGIIQAEHEIKDMLKGD